MKADAIESFLALTGLVGAAIVPDAESRILAFCIVGAALGAIIAAHATNEAVSKSQKVTRLLTNFSGGIMIGPLLTEYALDHWVVGMSPAYAALCIGGLCGFLAVGTLCIAGPAFFKWITSKTQKLP